LSEPVCIVLVNHWGFVPVSVALEVLRNLEDVGVRVALVSFPNVNLLGDQVLEHVLEDLLEFRSFEDEVDDFFACETFVEDLVDLPVLGRFVQHHPTDSHVDITQKLHQRLHMIQHVFFKQLTFDQVVF